MVIWHLFAFRGFGMLKKDSELPWVTRIARWIFVVLVSVYSVNWVANQIYKMWSV